MTTANVVFSSPASKVSHDGKEAAIKAGQSIYPGALVIISSGEWTVHATEGQGGDIYIADMNTVKQANATTVYAVGDNAFAFTPESGCTYNVILADGETTAVGSPLTSNGDGTVKVAATDGTESVLFYATEVVAASGSTLRVNARTAASGFSADTTT